MHALQFGEDQLHLKKGKKYAFLKKCNNRITFLKNLCKNNPILVPPISAGASTPSPQGHAWRESQLQDWIG